MNPVNLKFRHGGEMLVSPIGLRFVEDPDHGPLVLIPEGQGPRAYALDMTLEEAEQAFGFATRHDIETRAHNQDTRERVSELLDGWKLLMTKLGLADDGFGDKRQLLWLCDGGISPRLDALEAKVKMHGDHLDSLSVIVSNQGERLDRKQEVVSREIDEQGRHISSLVDLNFDRWKALKICLGLPDGWEHHHELAAEIKGALVVQAEEIDHLTKRLDSVCGICDSTLSEISLLKEEASLFTLAERVGELEESRTAQRKINRNIEKRVDWLTDHYPPPRSESPAPIEITWTQAGPCNAATGQLIECSSWKAPEKPKSAWKPLCDLKLGNISDQLLVRRIDYSSICAPASIHHHGLELELAVLQWATPPAYVKQDQFHLYEFCPIPE